MGVKTAETQVGNARFRETESSAVSIILAEQMFDLVSKPTHCTTGRDTRWVRRVAEALREHAETSC